MQYVLDFIADFVLEGLKRQADVRLQGQARQTIESVLRRARVHRGERAELPGIQGLEEIVCGSIADFADDEAIGPMAQSGFDKIANGYARRVCLKAWRISGLSGVFGSVLNQNDSLIFWNEIEERFHDGCFTGSCGTTNQYVRALLESELQKLGCGSRHRAVCNQFVEREPVRAKLAHGQSDSLDDRGHHCRNPGTVRKPSFENRVLVVCFAARDQARDGVDGFAELVLSRDANRELLHRIAARYLGKHQAVFADTNFRVAIGKNSFL